MVVVVVGVGGGGKVRRGGKVVMVITVNCYGPVIVPPLKGNAVNIPMSLARSC